MTFDALPVPITTYPPPEYLQQFTAEPAAARQLLPVDPEQFFIVPVEQLYPFFTQAVPPTRATAHTCLYLTSGTARMRIGNDSYTIGAHELLLVRAGEVHSFAPGDVNTGYLCHFHNHLLAGYSGSPDALASLDVLHQWGRPVLRLAEPIAGFIEQLLCRLLSEYQTHQLDYPAILRAYLLALLQEANRVYTTQAPAPLTAAVRLANHFKRLVATSLATTHQVRDYAALLHVSANHLSKCVRHVTGKSPARWIEESIVLEAQVLLFQSAWSVAEVALAVGIADASYFSRLFKKHTGVTPLAYRKKSHPS